MSLPLLKEVQTNKDELLLMAEKDEIYAVIDDENVRLCCD